MASSDVIVLKSIKPQKLNVEPFRRALLSAVESEGKVHELTLRKTTSSWKGARPTFRAETSISGGDLIVLTAPTGDTFGVQKWVWTDQGTKRHPIRARNAPTLWFQINYSAATRPGEFASWPAGSWPPWRRPVEVDHPGTKARGWSKKLSEERQKPFEKKVVTLLKTAASRAYP